MALVGILLDRYLGNVAAAIGLSVCLILLFWLHWGEIKPLVTKQSPTSAQNKPPTKPSVGPASPSTPVAPLKPPSKPNLHPNRKSGLELAVSLVNPTAPDIVVDNQTDDLAEGITWELVMFRTTDQAFFSYATQSIGYVKPHSQSARYAMDLNKLIQAAGTGGQIANGESFMGTLVVDCPTCLGTTLIVSFVWGDSGWFYKAPGGNGKLLMPKDMSKSTISQFIELINSTVKPEERTPILKIQ